MNVLSVRLTPTLSQNHRVELKFLNSDLYVLQNWSKTIRKTVWIHIPSKNERISNAEIDHIYKALEN